MRSRIEQQSIYKTDRQEFFEAVERFVPTDAWLGTVFSSNQYEYVFFGKAFNRKLLPIPYDDTILRLTQLREKPPQFFLQTPPRMQNPPTPDYLIIQNVILEQIEDTTGFEELASSEIGLTLFRWTEIEETVEHP